MYRFLQPYGSRKPPPGTPVNRQHPIGRRLVRSFIFNKPFTREAGGWRMYDSAGSDCTALYTRNNADTGWTNGIYGAPNFIAGADAGVSSFNLSDTLSQMGPGGITASSMSVIGRYMKVGSNTDIERYFTTTGGSMLIASRRAVGDAAGFLLASLTNGFYWIADGSGLAVGAKFAATPAVGIPYTVAGTYLRDTGVATFAGYWNLYLNGALQATNNLSTAGAFSGTFTNNAPQFGGYWDGTIVSPGTSDKQFDYLHIFNDVLTPGEVATITREPYCMFGGASIYRRGQFQNSVATGAPKFIAENFGFHPLCPMGV